MHMLDQNQSDETRQINQRKRQKFLAENAQDAASSDIWQGCHAKGTVIRGRLDYDRVGVSRTKPGRFDADSTLSMSCSDKIASWNVIGLGGSLLSCLLETIYLSSVTIADGFHLESLERALWKRVADLPNLPLAYSLARIPLIKQCTQNFKSSFSLLSDSNDSPCPSCKYPFSINSSCSHYLEPHRWITSHCKRCETRCVQVEWSLHKKVSVSSPLVDAFRSFACKAEFFERFLKIIDRCPSLPGNIRFVINLQI